MLTKKEFLFIPDNTESKLSNMKWWNWINMFNFPNLMTGHNLPFLFSTKDMVETDCLISWCDILKAFFVNRSETSLQYSGIALY